MAHSDDEELGYSSSKMILGRVGGDLFDDDSYVPHRIVSAKRVTLRKSEDWEIIENDTTALVLKGTRFSKKEKEFLRQPEGLVFLINSFKSGLRSVVKIKEQLARELK